MKQYLRLISISMIGVLLIIGLTLAADSGNLNGKILKTRKMSQPYPQFPDIKTCYRGLRATNNLSEATLISEGQIAKANSIKSKFQHIFSESGVKVNFIAATDNRTISFIRGDLGSLSQYRSVSAGYVKSAANYSLSSSAISDAQAALCWLATFSEAFGIEAAQNEFIVKNYFTDTLGKRHIRFQQVYKTIPVWAEELYFHIDEGDHIYAVNGQYEATPVQLTNLAPSITAEQALESSKSFLEAQNKWHPISDRMKQRFNIPDPSVNTVIWFDKAGEPHLVWFVDLYANLSDWIYLFVDAHSGEILHTINNRTNGNFVDASGTDLNNVKQYFRSYLQDGTYYMLSDINEFRVDASNNWIGGLTIWDLRNNDPSENVTIYEVTSTDPHSWSDAGTVSAMANAAVSYNYYKSTHNRKGIDDKASTIISILNVTQDGASMENAYWNGRAMFWGNGGSYFKRLSGALDITAHEMTHGVTQHTANLIYQDESGALNESMSDFFAAMVDRNDWLIGEDIMQPGRGIALRDMANPGNPDVLSPLPADMDHYVHTTDDHGGVHTNCGIANRAGYLVANSIGRSKAEKIYYRALSTYLTRQSVFIDARHALEQAASDLYGTSEVDAVKAAFDAVKVKSGSGYDPGDDDTVPTTGGSQWIAFVRDDLQVGMYDVANKTEYYLPDVKVKSRTNNYAQITATAAGDYIYFVNEDGKIARADVSKIPSELTYKYEKFDDIHIQTSGDLWNVAVMPNNALFAFTSEYEDDKNIYFYIDNEIYYLELDLPVTQENIEQNTIQYADVLDWSPNCKYPKLAFDAYNELNIAGGQTKNWWIMGEVDLSGDELMIYELLPPQPDGVSAGNVEYSSTNPDIIIFNHIDQNNDHWDIRIIDYDNSENNQWLTFPDRNVERPSFSPDDLKFVVDRRSDHKLLICTLENLSFEVLDNIDADAHYPEWFVIGGDIDVNVEDDIALTPSELALKQNYPNPFNPITTISYNLNNAGDVKLAIYNINGQRVKTLVGQHQTAGVHTINWDGINDSGQNVGSGVYFYKLQLDNSQVLYKKMILMK